MIMGRATLLQRGLRRAGASRRTKIPTTTSHGSHDPHGGHGGARYLSKHGSLHHEQRRSMAVYAVGEGWTGAMGERFCNAFIPGHQDMQETSESMEMLMQNPPQKIYDGRVQQVATGWGHTVILDADTSRVHCIGRPHDFQSLLRLNRLPSVVRGWIAQRINTKAHYDSNSVVSSIIGFATGSGTEHPSQSKTTWQYARDHTFLADWTEIELPSEPRNEASVIAANAGVTAVIGKSGMLYTFGLNNRGQCGVGSIDNNVWLPRRVVGLTSVQGGAAAASASTSPSASSKLGGSANDRTDQEEPMVDVCLGLQHGLALSSTGNVYSWGKGSRGQLGRELQSDQDEYAGVVWNRRNAIQIATGMYHGALLTSDNEVYLWGKNMKTVDGKLSDIPLPERLETLPTHHPVLQISCGSHHLSILFEDGSVYGIGLTADHAVLSDPIELMPPQPMPYKQFEAHQDRTTIVDRNNDVHQAHLWQAKSLQLHSTFAPMWDVQGCAIASVHRGWRSTMLVTQE